MYKFVAIDLDGTLLNSRGQITDKTKEAINKALSKGVEVVLASRKNDRFNKSFFERAWH